MRGRDIKLPAARLGLMALPYPDGISAYASHDGSAPGPDLVVSCFVVRVAMFEAGESTRGWLQDQPLAHFSQTRASSQNTKRKTHKNRKTTKHKTRQTARQSNRQTVRQLPHLPTNPTAWCLREAETRPGAWSCLPRYRLIASLAPRPFADTVHTQETSGGEPTARCCGGLSRYGCGWTDKGNHRLHLKDGFERVQHL